MIPGAGYLVLGLFADQTRHPAPSTQHQLSILRYKH
jgi:hypothetical protein